MNVLITGATGFIGQHLVRRLLAQDDRIIALDFAPNPALLAEFGDRITFVQADLADGAAVGHSFKITRPPILRISAFFLPPETETNPGRAHSSECAGLFHVFDAARASGVQARRLDQFHVRVRTVCPVSGAARK